MQKTNKKLYRWLDRLVVLLFNLVLLVVSITLPATSIASSKNFYQNQFEKTGIYATVNDDGVAQMRPIRFIGGNQNAYAYFTDQQLNEIIAHIIDYLFTDKASFALQMDNVFVGSYHLPASQQDNVDVFGDIAVSHMVDVKNLFSLVLVVCIISAVLLVGLGVYIVIRRKQLAPILFKYSLIFYGIFIALIGIFCGWVAIDAAKNEVPFMSQMWSHFHHLIFPFDADKFAGSFFNDTLTSILTLDFFLAAVATVLIIVGVVLLAWFICTLVLKKVYQRK